MISFFVSSNSFVTKSVLPDISVPKVCGEKVKTTELDDVFNSENVIKYIGVISRFRAG